MATLYHPDPEHDLFYRSDSITVYLLHFARPIHRAQHYIGSTDDLDRRLRQHRRTWPLYRIEADTLDALGSHVPDQILAECEDLIGKHYRRKHTFLHALHCRIDTSAFDADFLVAARRHRSNGLVMRANQLHISWCVARTWQANREFEMWLKRQHNARRFCPVCHNTTPPDEEPPF